MASKDSNLHTTDGPDRTEFNNWLMNRVSKQSSMISRAFGEKIIQYLRDRREKGVDSPQLKAKYDPGFRFNIKKRRFQLINVVGLGDILCLPVKDKVILYSLIVCNARYGVCIRRFTLIQPSWLAGSGLKVIVINGLLLQA